MNYLNVTGAAYKGGYQIEVCFNDSEKRLVDFAAFFRAHQHPQYDAYKNTALFQTFKVENGNLVWGDDWDLIFPVTDLYNGTIS